MHTEKNPLNVDVSRRKFVDLAIGTVASIPVVGGMFRVPTALAQEQESAVVQGSSELLPQSETDFGPMVDNLSDSVTVYVLNQHEVGFYVVDTTDNTGATKVPDCYITIENVKTHAIVDGYTDSNGVCRIDISSVADNEEGVEISELEEISLIGDITVSREGYRAFKLPGRLIQNNIAIRIPTRPLSGGLPYPYEISMDKDDIIYNVVNKCAYWQKKITPHFLNIEFRNVKPGNATIALKFTGIKKPLLSQTVRVVDNVAKVTFQGDFFNVREYDHFPYGNSYKVVLTQNNVSYTVSTYMSFDEPETPDIENQRMGLLEEYENFCCDINNNNTAGLGVKFKWPANIKFIGGTDCNLDWLKLAGLQLYVDYTGQAVLSMKSPTFGKKWKWKGNWLSDLQPCKDYATRRGFANGWSFSPKQDLYWEFADKYREIFGGWPSYAQNFNSKEDMWGRNRDRSLFDTPEAFLDANSPDGYKKRTQGSMEYFRAQKDSKYGGPRDVEDLQRRQQQANEEHHEAVQEAINNQEANNEIIRNNTAQIEHNNNLIEDNNNAIRRNATDINLLEQNNNNGQNNDQIQALQNQNAQLEGQNQNLQEQNNQAQHDLQVANQENNIVNNQENIANQQQALEQNGGALNKVNEFLDAHKQYLSKSMQVGLTFDVVLMIKWKQGKEYEVEKDQDGNPKQVDGKYHYLKDENGKQITICKARMANCSVAFHITLELKISFSGYYYFGGIPMIFTFDINASFVIAFSLGWKRYDTFPKDEEDKSWDDMMGYALSLNEYEWDWKGVSVTFTINVKIALGVGVGIRSLIEVICKGNFTLTYVWSRRANRPKDWPEWQHKASIVFKVTLLIKSFLHSKEFELWKHDLKADDNYSGLTPYTPQADTDDPSAYIEGDQVQIDRVMDDLSLVDMINEMKRVPTSDLEEVAEAAQVQESVLPQAEEDYDPVDWSELIEPPAVMETDEGVPITYRVINFPTYYDDDEEEEEEEIITADSDEVVALGDDENAVDLGLEDAKPVTVKRRKYRRPAFKNYEIIDNGIVPMASESDFLPDPNFEGVSDFGGIIPSARIKLHGGELGVYGDPRVKVVEFTIDQTFCRYAVDNEKHNIVYITAELRIGTALVGKTQVPRSRIIMTILDARYGDGERAAGAIINDIIEKRERVLDFPLSVVNHGPDEFNHEDFNDYDFDVKRKTTNVTDEESDVGQDVIQLAVVSGKREGNNQNSIGQDATNIIFSYISFHISDWFTKDVLELGVTISVIAAEANADLLNDNKFHNFSNLSISGGAKSTDKFAVIGYLDRYANKNKQADNAIDVFSNVENVAALTAGFIVIEFANEYTNGGRLSVSEPREIKSMLGSSTADLDIVGLEITPEIEGYYTLVLYSKEITYFYLFKIGIKQSRERDPKTGRLVTKSIPGVTSCIYADSSQDKLIACPQKDCFFTGESYLDDEGSVKHRLCEAHWKWDSGVPYLETTPIGGKEISVATFAMNGSGTFLFWTSQWDETDEEQTPVTVYGSQGEIAEGSITEVENQAMYTLWACRIREDHFCDPFILGALPYELHNFRCVNSRNRYAPLQIISKEEVPTTDPETGITEYTRCNVWYTGIPNIKICTAIEAYARNPYVTPGQVAYFYITIRNDGNAYLSGCNIQMYLHTGDEYENGEIVKYGDENDVEIVEGANAVLVFNEDTIQESEYNKLEDGKLTNLEDDLSLAPGKTSVYRVGIPIPESWNGENNGYRVSFVAEEPKIAKGGGISAMDDENGLEPIYISGSVAPGSVRAYPMRTTIDQSVEQRFMTIINTPEMRPLDPLYDAPVTVGDPTMDNVPEGNGGVNGTNDHSADAVVSGNGVRAGGSAATTDGNRTSYADEAGAAGNSGVSVGAAGRQATAKTADNTSSVLPAAIAAAGAAALAYERRRAKNENATEEK